MDGHDPNWLPGSPAPRPQATGGLWSTRSGDGSPDDPPLPRPLGRKRFLVVSSAAVALGGMFVWTGKSKLLDPAITLGFLNRPLGIPLEYARVGVLALAAAEWALGLWLILGMRQMAALSIAAFALCAFTGLLAFAQHRGFSGDCGCGFGSMSVQAAMVRNGILLAILAAALVASARASPAAPERGVS